MLLALNIGNTHVAFGFVSDTRIRTVRRPVGAFSSRRDFSQALCEAAKEAETDPAALAGAILASVRPGLTRPLADAAAELLGAAPLLVSPEMDMALDLSRYDTGLLGSDRIAVCEAAVAEYALPAVVFDFGTATTVNVIDADARFLGGAILPGLALGLGALAKDTAQLPESGALTPAALLGTNTRACLISGAVFGNAAMLDGMTARIKASLGRAELTVLVTGGGARAVTPYCATELIYEPELLMLGLRALYRRSI